MIPDKSVLVNNSDSKRYRTIADLAEDGKITEIHIVEAVHFRNNMHELNLRNFCKEKTHANTRAKSR